MKKINWENEPSTATPINADNLNLMQDNIEEEQEIIKGTLLYSNDSGEKRNVTLNDNISEYNIIEIFYTINTRSSSVKTCNFKNNEKISLNINAVSSSTYVNIIKEIQLQNQSIIKIQERTFYVYANGTQHSFSESDSIAITKVIGYKY